MSARPHGIDIAIPAHNVADCVAPTLDAVFAQVVPADVRLQVCIADDGSSDGLARVLQDYESRALRCVVHPKNLGRSAACNSAAALGDGDILVVLDADCRFADTQMLTRMLAHFSAGADAVLGTVDAVGSGFWARYAGQVSTRRVTAAQRDGPWHMTTANFAIRRRLFEELGGFSTRYRHYGFEDRDLLIRLTRTGAKVVVDPAVVVLHREPTVVGDVCWKLYQSGRHTAGEFSAQFPDEYQRSAYRRFDLSKRPRTARLLSPLIDVLAPRAQRLSDRLIARPWIGYGVQALSLRVASALAYLQGTTHAALDRMAATRAR